MRRTKEEAQETRIAIICSALPLFAAKGPSATNLVEVAKAAKLTRGAIYWHFKNKWELLDAVIDYYARPVNTFASVDNAEKKSDPLGMLRREYIDLLKNVAQIKEYQQVFQLCNYINTANYSVSQDEQQLVSRFISLREEKHNFQCLILNRAIELGQLPQNLDVEAGATMITSMLNGIVFNWISMPNSYSLAARAEQYVDALMSILRTELKISP